MPPRSDTEELSAEELIEQALQDAWLKLYRLQKLWSRMSNIEGNEANTMLANAGLREAGELLREPMHRIERELGHRVVQNLPYVSS